MRRVLAVLTARWFIGLWIAIGLAAAIWYLGPLVAIGDAGARPLGGERARLIAIGVVALIWVLDLGIARLRAWRRNRAMVAALAAPGPDDAAETAEAEAVRKAFAEALRKAGKRRLNTRDGRSWLYELPWYVMIGPPGSGKTTALTASGLAFAGGGEGLRGVGGTRQCEWYFSERAVFIDTAGRYTTQDSDRPLDAAAWGAFLDVLAANRPLQPLNGALVALSAADLLDEGEAWRAHARAVRARLLELQDRLGLVVPVYVLVTKADLVMGFTEFFDDLDEAGRRQVWGVTLPDGSAFDLLPRIRAELEALVERLVPLQPHRLQAESDLARRSRIVGFPGQMAILARQADRFVQEAFGGDKATEFWPRGVYVTSGTQEGTPVDRLVAALARRFGLAPTPPHGGIAGRPRPFFLTGLIEDVLLPEAGLVGLESRGGRAARRRLAGMAAAAAAAILVLGGAWAWSYARNAERATDLRARLAGVQETMATLAPNPLPSTAVDLRATLDPLGSLRETAALAAAPSGVDRFLGLSQRRPQITYADAAYANGLTRLLLPRLLLRVERDLWGRINDPDYVFQGLKAYLLLGERERQGTAEEGEDLVLAWLDRGWQDHLLPEEAEAMDGHVLRLLALPAGMGAPTPDFDEALIARARQTLTRLPLERHVYETVRAEGLEDGLPDWRFTEALGAGANLFERRSGEALARAVPGLFTYEGFHGYGLPALDAALDELAADWWVLGHGERLEPGQRQDLHARALRLYEQDYIRVWDSELADITLRPLGGIDDAARALLALAQPGSSPLQRWLEAVRHETALTVPPPEDAGDEGGGVGLDTDRLAKQALRVAKKATGKVGRHTGKLAKLVKRDDGAVGATAEEAPPGAAVEAHFAAIATALGGEGGGVPPIETALASLDAAYRQVNDVAVAARSGGTIPQGTGADQLAAVAAELPQPLQGMLGGVASGARDLGLGTARAQLEARWQADVLPLCQQALQGRFPFDPASRIDANLDDVVRLFAPGGLIDAFFETYLRPWVDTQQRPWRWREVEGRRLEVAPGVLAQFERAARIRNGLFALGTMPGAGFQLKPVSLDPAALQVSLDIDGQSLVYAHGPQVPQSFRWPGPEGQNVVRLAFASQSGQPMPPVVREGPFAWLRLLYDSRLRPGTYPDRFHVVFEAGPLSAAFDLVAGSVANPFDVDQFAAFRCPGRF